jgi:hypothetical protein
MAVLVGQDHAVRCGHQALIERAAAVKAAIYPLIAPHYAGRMGL